MRILYVLLLAILLMIFPLLLRVHTELDVKETTKRPSRSSPKGLRRDYTKKAREDSKVAEAVKRVKARRKRRGPAAPQIIEPSEPGEMHIDLITINETTNKQAVQEEVKVPPRFMVVALHSNIKVFPRIMEQILPQVNKEWMVSFVVAEKPNKTVERDWNEVLNSSEYLALSSVVNGIYFSQLHTKTERRNIANDFAFKHEWWKATPESIEYFWLVQDDSAVCSTNSKYCIYDFLGWDYLGAPLERVWWRMNWGSFGSVRPRFVPNYGNGGFSLRSRRLQVECTAPDYVKAHRRGAIPEDVYFSMCLRDTSMNFRVAPDNVAKQFSSERPLHVGSFGWHLQSSIRSCSDKMIRYCPEAVFSYQRWGCKLPKNVTRVQAPLSVTCHFNRTDR